MPDNIMIFLLIASLIVIAIFTSILIAMHLLYKKRESLLREQLNNLGLLLDVEESSLQKRILELEGQKTTEESYRKRIIELESQIDTRAQSLYYEWRSKELDSLREDLKANAINEAHNKLERWKLETEKIIREDSRKRSDASITGQVAERFTPYLPSFIHRYNPKDVRFIGSPIDLIVFDGADEGNVRKIIFVEVKTGNSSLSQRQQQIRSIIRDKKIDWEEIRWEQLKI